VSPRARARARARALPQRWFLILEGVPCGFLSSFSGGGPTADVLPEGGSIDFLRKRLGPARYEPITIAFGLSMYSDVYAWMAKAWKRAGERRRGTIIAVSATGKPVSALDFEEALIVETTLPELDAGSKSPAAITLTFAPARTKARKPPSSLAGGAVKQKQWLVANFQLQIGELDCSRVSKIEALAISSTAPVDFPVLRLTVAASSQVQWAQWLEEFVVQGLNDDAHEKSGVLTYLAPEASGRACSLRRGGRSRRRASTHRVGR
jgi:hypothetical protein